MKAKGFTLLELVLVVVVLGILASLALPMFTKTIEKARTAEAKTTLAYLRKMQQLYILEHGGICGTCTDLSGGAASGIPCHFAYACADSNYYFNYYCFNNLPVPGPTGTYGTCVAYRCTSGGKEPNISESNKYMLWLTVGGSGDSTPSGWW
jgi:prepilin-type N-terminal cleavage/methylation domain-containing protein